MANNNEGVVPPGDLTEDAGFTYVGATVTGTPTTLLPRMVVERTASWCLTQSTSKPSGSGSTGARRNGPSYRMMQRLGQGGMGEVWSARQESLHRTIAIKRIRAGRIEFAEQDEVDFIVAGFEREAFITAQLEHPNIVPIHDLGFDENASPLIGMKLVEGRPWDDVLREDLGALPYDTYLAKHLNILVDVANALDYAHSRQIIHRDLKPSQVMLGSYGEVLLMDWGLAIFLGDPTESEKLEGHPNVLPLREDASSPAGTPAYMAPEQTHEDPSELNYATDIFLLGGTLYNILTGEHPHKAPTAQFAFVAASQCRIEPPSVRKPDFPVPEELDRLCMDCLRPQPSERLENAGLFRERLEAFLTGETRKAESRSITADVAELDFTNEQHYRPFNEALNRLDKARTLWPENPKVHAIEQDLLQRLCVLAIESEDYRLASLQIPRLENARTREEMQNRIDLAVATKARKDKQRRRAIAAAFALLIVVLISTAFFLSVVHQKNAVVMARNQAMADRADKSYDFTNAMLEELTRDLDLQSARDQKIAESVAMEVLKYYSDMDLSRDDDEIAGLLIMTMAETASTLFSLGRWEEGEKLTNLCYQKALERFPPDSYYTARAYSALAEAAKTREDTETALEMYTKSLEILELYPDRQKDFPNGVRLGKAMALLDLEEYDQAEEELLEAIHADQKRLDDAETIEERNEVLEDLSYGYNNWGILLSETDRQEESIAKFEEAVRLKRLYRDPRSPDLAVTIANLGLQHMELGHWEKARELLQESYELHLGYLEPGNPELQWICENLFYVEFDLRNYEKAAEYGEKDLASTKSAYGVVHEETADLEEDLIDAYVRSRNWEQAAAHLKEYIFIVDQLDDEVRHAVQARGDYYAVLTRLGRDQEAQGIQHQWEEQYERLDSDSRRVRALYYSTEYMNPEMHHDMLGKIRDRMLEIDFDSLSESNQGRYQSVLILYQVGVALQSEGSSKSAEEWQNVINLFDETGEIPYREEIVWIGIAYTRLGDKERGTELIWRFLQDEEEMLTPPLEWALIDHGLGDILAKWEPKRLAMLEERDG
ncbi:serine/threonine-protein kinase [bacterium]|nr:serine/threonine-protein kinase [bacterium]